jgi:hypothetical protein
MLAGGGAVLISGEERGEGGMGTWSSREGGGRARECLTGVEARFGWGEPGVRLLVEPWVQVMDP